MPLLRRNVTTNLSGQEKTAGNDKDGSQDSKPAFDVRVLSLPRAMCRILEIMLILTKFQLVIHIRQSVLALEIGSEISSSSSSIEELRSSLYHPWGQGL